MNHIERLTRQAASVRAEADALHEGINDLLVYLASDKFASDPTVQVADVQRRLRAASFAALDAADQANEVK